MVRVATVSVAAALCAAALRRQVPEICLVLALAAGMVVMGCTMGALGGVYAMAERLAETAGLSPEVFTPVMKIVGIGAVSHISAELCRDAKEGGIAAFVEIAGAGLSLFAALPLLEAVLRSISALLE